MPDPIVTMVVDSDGVERWGSVDAPWVKKLAEEPSAEAAQPGEAEPPDSSADSTEPVKEGKDATPVPSDSDRPKPRSTRN